MAEKKDSRKTESKENKEEQDRKTWILSTDEDRREITANTE